MAYGRLPDESPEYAKRREELLQAEITLKDQLEGVAALRRELPRDTALEDYALTEGPPDLRAGDEPVREVRLSQLFERRDRPLVLVHFMFGKKVAEPCPMCTLWADGYAGLVPHLSQRMNFGVVVAGDLATFRSYARERGWDKLRMLSSGDGPFKRDLGFEHEDGGQDPGVSVFTLGRDGRPRHFYSGSAYLSEGHWRGMDLLSPFWHFLDLTPAGRGDFMPRRSYEAPSPRSR